MDAPAMSVTIDNDSEFTVYLRSFSEGTGRFELAYASLEEALAGEEDSKPIAPDVFVPAVEAIAGAIAESEAGAAETAAKDASEPRYTEAIVTSPTSGTYTIVQRQITTFEPALTNANAFTLAMPTPVDGEVNEAAIIFEVGATLPSISHPENIVWYGKTPTLEINKKYTFYYLNVKKTAGRELQGRWDTTP
jgi:hypothetical protein